MTDVFVQFPTKSGDVFIRPSLIHMVENDGAFCFVYVDMCGTRKLVSVTIDAASVVERIKAALSPAAPDGSDTRALT